MSAPTIDAPAAFLAARKRTVIGAPGIYDMAADDYHADPVEAGSLSTSGAKKLLPPSCPALFRHEQLHGRPPKREFDFGTAAHAVVLGSGPAIVEIDADSWRTGYAKDAAADARDEGAVPLLSHEYAVVMAMAEALRTHPSAARLLSPEWGIAEQSMFFVDRPTGVMRRGRLDILPYPTSTRMIVPDYKTCRSADLDALSKDIHAYAYHQQAACYIDGLVALDRAGTDAEFVFVFQEKAAPYLVRVVRPDVIALRIGRELNRRAIELYAECKATDTWPGFSEDIDDVPLPAWVENSHEWDQA